VAWNEARPESITHDSLEAVKRESPVTYAESFSLPLPLYLYSVCSPFENAPSNRTVNTRYPLIWICFSQIWTWIYCYFFFFIHRPSSSFDTQDNPWCLRPTRWLLTRLFAEKNTPSRHQTSRFLFHRNCAPSSWDHLRSLVDWTIEPAPWSRHRNWSQQNPTSSSACWIHWDAQWRFCCPLSSG